MKSKVIAIEMPVALASIAGRAAALIAGVAVAIAFLGGASTPAMAVEIAGVKIADRIALAQGGPELVLNGAGVRRKLMTVDVYVGALYLASARRTSQEVMADPGPKRVLMHVLIDELSAKELIASLNNAIAANLIPAEIALIEKRLTELNRMMNSIGSLKRGGVVYVDFVPGSGTRITVNNVERITIPGNDFFQALLRIWIGKKPVDGQLRDALLGGK